MSKKKELADASTARCILTSCSSIISIASQNCPRFWRIFSWERMWSVYVSSTCSRLLVLTGNRDSGDSSILHGFSLTQKVDRKYLFKLIFSDRQECHCYTGKKESSFYLHQTKITPKIVFNNPLPNDKFLDLSKVKAFALCRRQNKCNLKTETLFEMGRKHCGKRKKCWLPTFSHFPQCFQKALFQGH